MTNEIHIRTVAVELLRAGPAHNQLLSPLTQYLGICGDAEAGIVMLPYEQHTFERRMRHMRHQDQADDSADHPAARDRLPDLRDLGVEMAKVLGAIPRLPGALAADPRGQDTLVWLCLTLSASELAGLPFELAKVPVGPNACTESWLSLQSRVPVVITRRTRNVAARDLPWLHSPRVLFVSADASNGNVPFAAHKKALLEALKPIFGPMKAERSTLRRSADVDGNATGEQPTVREQYADRLTVLSNASFEHVVQECARHCYTHVHLLAHGERNDHGGDKTHGLRLHHDDGVISGERLASALTSVVAGKLHRPQVVTLATCDSGNVSDVQNPGASIAHALHQAGVALVVASQVPLSFDASVLFAREFYSGLMWGEHPWMVMHHVRAMLHAHLRPIDHDWASLVVYEALPFDMSRALEEARFRQCRYALAQSHTPIEVIIDKLQVDGRYFGMESLALRADGFLQMARYAYISVAEECKPAERHAAARDSCWLLEKALVDYEKAVSGFLVSPGQGMNAPYRTLVAQLSIMAVLGKKPDWDMWHMARHWVKRTISESSSHEDKVWAQGCHAELWLLRLLDDGYRALALNDVLSRATSAMRNMVRMLDRSPNSDDDNRGLPQYWIEDRLRSYIEWWGDPAFEDVLQMMGPEAPRASFRAAPTDLAAAAKSLLAVLDRNTGNKAGSSAAADDDDGDTDGAGPASRAKPSAAAAKVRKPEPAAAPQQNTAPAAPANRLLSAKPPATVTAAGTFFDLEMLPADYGDALWLEWGLAGQGRWRMLVDCGPEHVYEAGLGARLRQQPLDSANRHFELFIMSHIDGDHISGAIPFLQEAQALGVSFGDIWFNGREHLETKRMLSAKDGDDFSTLLRRLGLPWNEWRKQRAVVRPHDALPTCTLQGGMLLTLLSPTPPVLLQLAGEWDKELAKPGRRRHLKARQLEPLEDLDRLVQNGFEPDGSKPNGSSIAVLAEFQGKRVLLGADAYAPVLAEALALLCKRDGVERLRLDAFKLPHHGSKGNLNDAVMRLIDCQNYLVSTSNARFDHPDREAMARVVKHSAQPAKLWFNYPPKDTYHQLWSKPALQQKYGYQALYPPAGTLGVKLALF